MGTEVLCFGYVVLLAASAVWMARSRTPKERDHIGSLPVNHDAVVDWTGSMESAREKNRHEVAEALPGRRIETEDVVREVLFRRDPARQATALEELIRRGEGVEALETALASPSAEVREAGLALARLLGAPAEAVLAAAWSTLPEPEALQALAILGDSGGAHARGALVKALREGRAYQLRALESLALCGTAGELPDIEPLTPQRIGPVDDMARQAVAAIRARIDPDEIGRVSLAETHAEPGALSLDASGAVSEIAPEGGVHGAARRGVSEDRGTR